MTYYTHTWTVMQGEKRINLVFVRKKDALAWIAEQDNPTDYSITKESMF